MRPFVIAAWGCALAAAILIVGIGVHQHYAGRACAPAKGGSIKPVAGGGVGKGKCAQDRQLADQTLVWMGVALVVVVMGTGVGCALARGGSSSGD